MGLAQQLAGFIPYLAHASELLRHLLKKEKAWMWDDNIHQPAFKEVIKILTSAPVLTSFHPSRLVYLLTDASRWKGLGFALVHSEMVESKQKTQLVSCGSRSLTSAERNYAVCELEALAIKWALKKCRNYLLRIPHFDICTDHRPLEPMWTMPLDNVGNERIQKWRESTSQYNFMVNWVPGKTHYIADFLSRAQYWGAPEEEKKKDIFCLSNQPD
jgi:hypothetical protein